MDWAERYRPKHLTNILGNNTAVKQMINWAQNWNMDSHPLLITGKPGIGKTSAAIALARDMNWEVLELNASDTRTKTIIECVAGNSAMTTSLFGFKRKLIIIDETDNLEGNADRGGARAIADLLKEACQPVILIANDAYGVSESIRKLCDQIPFRSLSSSTLEKGMRNIIEKEQISCSNEALKEIAESASGDMRAAINMLFAAATGKSMITKTDVHTSQKDERASIFELVSSVYAGASDEKIQKLSRECEEKPDTIMQWIEEAASSVENSHQRRGAYTALSRGDIYLGSAIRRQYYTLWRYAISLITLGVAKEFSGAGIHIRPMPPLRWRRMNIAKKQKIIRKGLAAKLGERYSIPESQIHKIYLDLLSYFAIDTPLGFCERHNLDADQLTILLHDRSKATEICKEIRKLKKENENKIKKVSSSKQDISQRIEEKRETGLETFHKKEHLLDHLSRQSNPGEMPISGGFEHKEKKKIPKQSTLDFF
ncbi:MAG TPA: replication factor C large subunit [Methanocorpusculum sp.]|nr:replication factor C large subunit [Methanocorpusculum sp.]